MRKEMLKGITMAVLTITLALATAVVSANAQSSNRVAAAIPFNFGVGGQTMAAGDYILGSISSDGEGLLVRSKDSGKSVVRLTNSIQPSVKNTNARLVFHRYGQRYFLAEVWGAEGSTGRKLTESREERAIRREFGKLAQNSYETVELSAKLR
ncbi:MAG: hypothetical protein ABI596_06750 [Pyrinomonadaceae bacterium]